MSDNIKPVKYIDPTATVTCMSGFVNIKYDPTEQRVVLNKFYDMLEAATKDGGKKRAAGTKPPWYVDTTHERALYSHLSKWQTGEMVDKDSGAHPLVHLAWRALAIAYQE